MSKVCPFMSGTEVSRWGHGAHEFPRGIHYQQCLEERCMMWEDGCVFPRKFSTKERPRVGGPPCPFCGGESTFPLMPIEGDIFKCLVCKKHFHAPSPVRISKEAT